jgi:hypothetical protein
MDQSPTALYEQDFKGILAGVKTKLDGDATTGSAGT